MIKRSLFLAALVGLCLTSVPVARAEPVPLTKSEAFELHDSLTKLSPGLTPENTLFAADAINALASDAQAWRAGYTKLMVLQAAANAPGATPDSIAAFRAEDAKFSVAAETVKTYDLTLFTITKEEIKASVNPQTGLPAMSANSIATIKRLLRKTTVTPPSESQSKK